MRVRGGRLRPAQLLAAAGDFERADEEEEGVAGFLHRASLFADADTETKGRGMPLMTLHTAKGLEFDTVFMVGMEDGLFPHAQSSAEDDDVEEERRLCYVGMTRAERALFLSGAAVRRTYGRTSPSPPSRFISEIPLDCLDEAPEVATSGVTARQRDRI